MSPLESNRWFSDRKVSKSLCSKPFSAFTGRNFRIQEQKAWPSWQATLGLKGLCGECGSAPLEALLLASCSIIFPNSTIELMNDLASSPSFPLWFPKILDHLWDTIYISFLLLSLKNPFYRILKSFSFITKDFSLISKVSSLYNIFEEEGLCWLLVNSRFFTFFTYLRRQ